MELIIKAAVVGCVATLLALLIKKGSPELSLLLALGAGLLCLSFALSMFKGFREVIDVAVEVSGLSDAILLPVLKCVGIGIVAKLSADMCRDGGQSSIASGVELVGAFCALFAALPLIKTMLVTISEMAQ